MRPFTNIICIQQVCRYSLRLTAKIMFSSHIESRAVCVAFLAIITRVQDDDDNAAQCNSMRSDAVQLPHRNTPYSKNRRTALTLFVVVVVVGSHISNTNNSLHASLPTTNSITIVNCSAHMDAECNNPTHIPAKSHIGGWWQCSAVVNVYYYEANQQRDGGI